MSQGNRGIGGVVIGGMEDIESITPAIVAIPTGLNEPIPAIGHSVYRRIEGTTYVGNWLGPIL